ncbi:MULTISPECIES: GNAT family N-acetyltransferase [Acidobacteriaceae]|uniref:GNAT family N-acetyltransferase n=1 Tax=Acidobacteriaceae TaxID=204434 RepID=UPI00131D40AE|nr:MULTISPECIES: GNAT family N-acetyltransferase [Acidobacteriaceae]MDW5265332.1 GNAT family N-acetyltransferase [Edaphobacter sp.]
MSGFCVRAGVVGDLAAVMALERATAEAPHWGEEEYAAAIGGTGDYVRRRLFVAAADGAVIGFAVGKVAGDLAELESVAVDLRLRRGGVGRELCGAVIAWCREECAGALELEVRAASGGAIGLYRGLGFTPVGQRPRYYSEPVDDAVLMRLDLLESA